MVYFHKIGFDFLKFEGNDRLDLINRLSTNEVNSLEKFRGIRTILTSDKGRIIDILTLFNFGDFVFSLCSAGNSGKVISHLDKYTIMDDFRAVNMTGTHEAVLFFGKEAGTFSKELFGRNVTALERNDFVIHSEDMRDALVTRNDDLFGGVYFIYAVEDKEYWDRRLFSEVNTSKFSFSEVSEFEYEAERIEKGIPAFGKELTESVNPLECGLNNYVSFTKGCYIGQEVVARLDAYDKISKHLVGIKAGEDISPDETGTGLKIYSDGKECGFTTSAAYSETLGYLGLGFVKTIFLNFENRYEIKKDGRVIECTLSKLPFELN
jgi:folate-binding protein YgfZ